MARKLSLATIFLAWCMLHVAHAQSTFGDLRGTTRDPSGLPLPQVGGRGEKGHWSDASADWATRSSSSISMRGAVLNPASILVPTLSFILC